MKLAPFLIVAALLCAPAQAMDCATAQRLLRPETVISGEEFGQRMLAVHATNSFPHEGVLKAGARRVGGTGSVSADAEPAAFRPSVHFALGGLIQEHRTSWEDRMYAVIAPVGALREQLLNLSPSDTFVLGDWKLPKGSILLVPNTTTGVKVPEGVRVVTYDQRAQGLRAAIDKVIQDEGGWHLETPKHKPGHDAQTRINGEDVDFNRLSAGFLKENPRVSDGSHIVSTQGIAGHFGRTEKAINSLSRQYGEMGRVYSTREVEFLRYLIQANLETLDAELAAAQFPAGAMKTYQDKRDKLKGWVNLVDADLALRKEHGRTFAGTKERAMRLAALRDTPEKLANAVESGRLRGMLADLPEEEHVGSTEAAEWLNGTSRAEFEKHFEKLKELDTLTAPELSNLRHLFAVHRILNIGMAGAKKEGLVEMLSDNLEPTRAATHGDTLLQAIGHALEKRLDIDSNQRQTALEIAQLPAMRKAFKEAYGVELPTDKPLTLDGYMRVHPETRLAYQKLDFPDLNPQALAIVQKIQPDGYKKLAGGVETLPRFSEAQFRAMNVEAVIDETRKAVIQLNEPVNSIRKPDAINGGDELSFYEQMAQGNFGAPVEVWGALGLAKEYRAAFPTDAQFWKSNSTFQEIYDSLKRAQAH